MNLFDLVLNNEKISGVYNVSTGSGNTMKDIFDAVVSHLGIELEEEVLVVPPGEDDVPSVVLDPTKTMRDFDWKPKVAFIQTIENMLRWYDENGINAIYSHLKAPEKPS